jgi:hypothetical protein
MKKWLFCNFPTAAASGMKLLESLRLWKKPGKAV